VIRFYLLLLFIQSLFSTPASGLPIFFQVPSPLSVVPAPTFLVVFTFSFPSPSTPLFTSSSQSFPPWRCGVALQTMGFVKHSRPPRSRRTPFFPYPPRVSTSRALGPSRSKRHLFEFPPMIFFFHKLRLPVSPRGDLLENPSMRGFLPELPGSLFSFNQIISSSRKLPSLVLLVLP